ncbi:hypothetical protein [Bartonella grahamii]|nr:hypothetical protein [Bartonella grahamii]
MCGDAVLGLAWTVALCEGALWTWLLKRGAVCCMVNFPEWLDGGVA